MNENNEPFVSMVTQLNIDMGSWCRHLLSHLDRDRISVTAGSFDRRYWAWKSRDFSDASLQYAAVPLLKASRICGDNIGEDERQYYINAAILAAKYLLLIQHPNGSFDQCYPYERHPGVVFDVLPLWTMLLSDYSHYLDETTRVSLQDGFERGIAFVLRTRENYAVISNHLAHFAWVLFFVDQNWNRPDCRKLAEHYLDIIFTNQSVEGWYLEYEGPDMGYQTRTISYLARISQICNDALLRTSVDRALSFLCHFAYPDGSFGGEVGCRNTSIVYLYGLAWFARKNADASALMQFFRDKQGTGRGVLLQYLDFDNLIRVFDDYLDAHEVLLCNDVAKPSRLPFEHEHYVLNYPEAGIVVRRCYWYYAVVNMMKGGIYKIYDVSSKRLVCSDTGWVYNNKRHGFTNHYIQKIYPMIVEENRIRFSGRFFRFTNVMLSPFRLIVLRMLNLTLWKIQWVSDIARKIISKAIFTQKVAGDTSFEREFNWGRFVRIETILRWEGARKRLIRFTSNFTSLPMASSKYFQVSDLSNKLACEEDMFTSGHKYIQNIEEPQDPVLS